jgi:hypothetical protein
MAEKKQAQQISQIGLAELKRLARIAALRLGYHSLRDYEIAMHRKAVEDAEKIDKPMQQRTA